MIFLSVGYFVGHDLLTRLKPPGNSEDDPASTLDNLEDQKQVKRLITYLENRVDKLQNLLEDRDRSLSLNLEYEDFQRNVKHVSSEVKQISSYVAYIDVIQSVQPQSGVQRLPEECQTCKFRGQTDKYIHCLYRCQTSKYIKK